MKHANPRCSIEATAMLISLVLTIIAKLLLLPLLHIITIIAVETSSFSITMTTTTTTATTAAAAATPASPPLLSPPFINELAVAANAFSSAHGIQVESRRHNSNSDGTTSSSSSSSYYQSAPISLLPNAYPKPAFDRAVALAPSFNVLVDRVSRDAPFLQQTLGGSVAQADPFTARLLALYHEIYNNDDTKVPAAIAADRLGIHRSDYMLHKTSSDGNDESYSIKQVELNTIAASFAGLSCQVAKLHHYLLQRYDTPALRNLLTAHQTTVGGHESFVDCHVPTNPTLERLPQAMNVVVERYQARFNIPARDDVVVLFVVQDGETNTVDQRMLEFKLYENHGLAVIRASLATIDAEATLDSNSGRLVLHEKEVALVYFRAGYAPTDYITDDNDDDGDNAAWRARATLEKCRAAKCPALGYHLAGTKKVQQALARPGVLERYFGGMTTPSDDEADVTKTTIQQLRAAFAGLYSLDGDDITDDDRRAIRQILSDKTAADRYVLKPQREGGGYNFYGPDLYAKIQANVTVVDRTDDNDDTDDQSSSLTLDQSLGEYILMERLFPPPQTAILMRHGQVEGSGDTISELGCFGTIIVDGTNGTVIHNEYAGFLLRTKFSTVNEGGVASGFATLSSPYLC
jgi:glutathione synthase